MLFEVILSQRMINHELMNSKISEKVFLIGYGKIFSEISIECSKSSILGASESLYGVKLNLHYSARFAILNGSFLSTKISEPKALIPRIKSRGVREQKLIVSLTP